MTEGISQLKKTVDTISALPEEDWIAFSILWKEVSEKRKHTITVAGSQEKYLYFVLEGVQRVFYLDDEGREATLIFTYFLPMPYLVPIIYYVKLKRGKAPGNKHHLPISPCLPVSVVPKPAKEWARAPHARRGAS